jgi:hypothetical protein
MAGPSKFDIGAAPRRAQQFQRDLDRGTSLFRPTAGRDEGVDDLAELTGDYGYLTREARKDLLWVLGSGRTGWFVVNAASSTWVSRYGYWTQNGQRGLAIQFHDGATCWYPSLRSYNWYGAMDGAASKGKFIHAYIYKKVGYQLISG